MKKIIAVIVIFLLIIINLNVVNAEDLNCSNIFLKYGSNNSNVALLQEKLNRTSSCMLDRDGIFGNQTRNCVKKFQEENKLENDGIVGPLTCQKLNSVYNTLESRTYGVVTADVLNVRQSPNTSSTILKTLKQGTILRIYNTTNGWHKIKIKKSDNTYMYAYVSADWLKTDAILLNINTQTVKLFKDGKLKLTAPVVTGQKGNHDTPTGRFYVEPNTNLMNTVLRGRNDDGSSYASPVKYWMPFVLTRGIGFHDANWRSASEFTPERYTVKGSHGCVNMKTNDAKYLYENITKKIVVIVK